ncbi:hypothetical protein Tco_0796275 [Tanacetum coccineum]
MKSVASILEGFIDDLPFEENDDLFDLECKTNDWKRILYDAPIDKAECFDPGGDNDEIDAFLAIEVPTYIEEGYYDSEGDVLYLESLLSDDNTHNIYFPRMILFTMSSAWKESSTIPCQIVREHEDFIRSNVRCNLRKFHLLWGWSALNKIFIQSSSLSHHLLPLSRIVTLTWKRSDIFSGPDDSIPPGIESDFGLEEDVIDNLLTMIPFSNIRRLTLRQCVEPDVPKQCTDSVNFTRKRPKPDKHGHENGKECTRAGDLIAEVSSKWSTQSQTWSTGQPQEDKTPKLPKQSLK